AGRVERGRVLQHTNRRVKERTLAMKPTITAIIGCEHSPEFLSSTLDAIEDDDIDVIVVDTVGLPGRAEVVIQASGRGLAANYLNLPGTQRPTAWNIAARQASGEVLAFLDDDCIPTPGWHGAVRSSFRSPDVGAVGGPDKVPEEAPIFEQSLEYILTSFVGTLGMRSGKQLAAYYPRPWNMAVSREAFLQTDGFDEASPEAPELPMLSSIEGLGYKIIYQPQAVVGHYRETDFRGFICRDFRLSMERGRRQSQPRLDMLYGAACAILLAAGIAAVRKPDSRVPKVMAGAYSALLGFSGIHAAKQLRRPVLSILVPPLLFAHHAAHVAGFASGKTLKLLTRGRIPLNEVKDEAVKQDR
ncbi:MAG TPA: glycosyltransferase, partial [Armatimonadota bacterium]